jgi:pyridoxamine 5'-phosphate oxidase
VDHGLYLETLPEAVTLRHLRGYAAFASPALLECRSVTASPVDPVSLVVADRERARSASDPMADLCVLATAGSADGTPGVRPIVLRDVGPQGVGLLISQTSPKWESLASGRCEVLLLWLTIRRQYRVRGAIAPMPEALIERYWNQKVLESRLLDLYYARYGAQSTVVASRERFLEGIEALRQRYPAAEAVPRPELLRGVYLVPDRIEAWRGSPDRLHDRRRFVRESSGWREETLVP